MLSKRRVWSEQAGLKKKQGDLSQSETEKYFEWIVIMYFIPTSVERWKWDTCIRHFKKIEKENAWATTCVRYCFWDRHLGRAGYLLVIFPCLW